MRTEKSKQNMTNLNKSMERKKIGTVIYFYQKKTTKKITVIIYITIRDMISYQSSTILQMFVNFVYLRVCVCFLFV